MKNLLVSFGARTALFLGACGVGSSNAGIVAPNLNESKVPATKTQYIWGPYIDFWALGGASIVLWLLLLVADLYKGISPPAATRFSQVAIAFSFLSVFVNYPHFMISYKFGYGRGGNFILRNWIPLLAIPLGMILCFALAYLFFDYDVSSSHWLLAADNKLSPIGIDLGIKYRGALGREILLSSIWIMYFTVGWHYSKQVFGALMIYAKLRQYFFSGIEKKLIKWNLFSVAIYQFVYLNRLLLNAGSNMDPRFPGIVITGLDIPEWTSTAASTFLVTSTVIVTLIFARLFFIQKKKPELNFLVAWISFFIWWIPVKNLPEFYAMAVPFFHSFQYLLFASKLEESNIKERPHPQSRMIAVVVLTLIAGVAGFEIVPAALDTYFSTSVGQSAWFFMSVTGVFFNIHHFFIDSAVWKFDQVAVKRAFFS